MTVLRRSGILTGGVLLIGLSVGGAARADGYPPFYGYSGYFGGPAAYFTQDTDVRQVTSGQESGITSATRTYYRGGPFWTYRPSRASTVYRTRPERRRTVLHSKG